MVLLQILLTDLVMSVLIMFPQLGLYPYNLKRTIGQKLIQAKQKK